MKKKISIKFIIKAQGVNANTSYYLFKWDIFDMTQLYAQAFTLLEPFGPRTTDTQ